MRVLTCSTVCVAALLVLYPIVGHTQLDTAFQGSDTLPARRAALDVEEEYLAPSNPLPAAQRGVCSGLGQLETLKGDWVDHEDAQYRGFNPNATCPSFLHDYECLADYIDEKYSERQAQVMPTEACSTPEPIGSGRMLHRKRGSHMRRSTGRSSGRMPATSRSSARSSSRPACAAGGSS